jgi:hypothetical protein
MTNLYVLFGENKKLIIFERQKKFFLALYFN